MLKKKTFIGLAAKFLLLLSFAFAILAFIAFFTKSFAYVLYRPKSPYAVTCNFANQNAYVGIVLVDPSLFLSQPKEHKFDGYTHTTLKWGSGDDEQVATLGGQSVVSRQPPFGPGVGSSWDFRIEKDRFNAITGVMTVAGGSLMSISRSDGGSFDTKKAAWHYNSIHATILQIRISWWLLLSASLFLALPVIFLLSRTIRQSYLAKNGFCIHCGYDLHGISIECHCPECGSSRENVSKKHFSFK